MTNNTDYNSKQITPGLGIDSSHGHRSWKSRRNNNCDDILKYSGCLNYCLKAQTLIYLHSFEMFVKK